MPSRLALAAILAVVPACVPDWDPPSGMVCADGCSTSTAQPASTGDETPTTGDGVNTVTDTSTNDSSGSTTPDAESGAGTTGELAELPLIVTRVVMPDYTAENAILDVSVTAKNAEGVRMLLENGDEVELTPAGPGEFSGGIEAFTALDNGKHMAIFSPWRDVLSAVSTYFMFCCCARRYGRPK